jgi:hypothetical protein
MGSEDNEDPNVSGNWVHNVTENVSTVEFSEEGIIRKSIPPKSATQPGFLTIQVFQFFCNFNYLMFIYW